MLKGDSSIIKYDSITNHWILFRMFVATLIFPVLIFLINGNPISKYFSIEDLPSANAKLLSS